MIIVRHKVYSLFKFLLVNISSDQTHHTVVICIYGDHIVLCCIGKTVDGDEVGDVIKG